MNTAHRHLNKELVIATLPEADPIGDEVMKNLKKMKDHRFRRVAIDWHNFANGEFTPELKESVRHAHVYLIGAPGLKPSEDIMRAMFAINALATNDAFTIRCLLTHITNDREDKTSGRRTALTAGVIADMLLMNRKVERIITLDPHCDQMQGFYKVDGATKLDILKASPLLIEHIKAMNPEIRKKLVIISPDAGGAKRAQKYAEMLGPDVGYGNYDKRRPKDNVAEVSNISCNVSLRGRYAIIIDDMADTCGSLIATQKALKKKGAKVVCAMVTHWIGSPDTKGVPAEDRIREAGLKIVATNSIPRTAAYYEARRDFLTIINLSRHIARTIHEMSTRGGCLSDLNK